MSWQATLMNGFMRLNKWHLSGKDFSAAKAAMINMADKRAAKAAVPDGAETIAVSIDEVPCEWVFDKASAVNAEAVILYFHGGGFFAGSPATHRDAAHRLSAATGMKSLVVDYRLTPDHIFPAALEDATKVYRWLLANGYQANQIAFGGDSAGGNMTLSVMKMLQQQDLPLPFAGFCISPWADLTHSGASWHSNRRKDVMIPSSLLQNAAIVYAGDTPLDDPLVSPVYADLHGFPPLYVIAGATEVLLDDAELIYDRANACGVRVEKKIWPNMPHAFTSMGAFLPEARHAITDIAEFLSSVER